MITKEEAIQIAKAYLIKRNRSGVIDEITSGLMENIEIHYGKREGETRDVWSFLVIMILVIIILTRASLILMLKRVKYSTHWDPPLALKIEKKKALSEYQFYLSQQICTIQSLNNDLQN